MKRHHPLKSVSKGIDRGLRGNRQLAISFALLLLAVPTAAALFPGFVFRTQRCWRVLVMVLWLGVAWATAVAAHSRERRTEAMAQASHRNLIRSHLTLLLEPHRCEIPECYDSCVYLDSDRLLLPWFPDFVDDPTDVRVFRYGNGATGRCFSEQQPVVVVGDAVSNGEYGLTLAQQEAFEGYQVVVAVPIRRLDDSVIGALTVISQVNDSFFATPDAVVQDDGLVRMKDLADEIGLALEEVGQVQ